MKIETTICDICGKKIGGDHPPRLILEKYGKETNYSKPHYAKEKQFDLCTDCADNIVNTLGSLVHEED